MKTYKEIPLNYLDTIDNLLSNDDSPQGRELSLRLTNIAQKLYLKTQNEILEIQKEKLISSSSRKRKLRKFLKQLYDNLKRLTQLI